MTGALIILIAVVVVGVVLYVWHRYDLRKNGEETNAPIIPLERPEGCCGQHEVCEKDLLLTGVSSKIEYYEDEELDAYKGIGAEDYNEVQIEQFRDVLYTLRPEEIAGWGRSIQLRGITLPSVIRDELLMIIAEMRASESSDLK